MKDLIAILDDEKEIVDLISIHLKKASYTTIEFYKAKDLLSYMQGKYKKKPSLIILDLMLPDIDGFEVCKVLKNNFETKDIPIIMLTAKQDETDKCIGLEIGADDYVTKPFSVKELLARVKAILRRVKKSEEEEKKEIIEVPGYFTIDLKKYKIYTVEGDEIELTLTEFKLLQIMAEKIGWVFSREKILDLLYGNEKFIYDRTIDVHIKNLREKLGKYGTIIKNIRGVGYKIEI
ncbi:MAG TPA: response regulator transcription factor [Spirochaetota bacterium]|nr:response regulator transcription factor [Spirochaetota bacterium]HOL57477.1 response regulator transcription factor [Spirochaetota bacterium]HPP05054.1 response regulator transcription factor [Spirochaetota bacterium]